MECSVPGSGVPWPTHIPQVAIAVLTAVARFPLVSPANCRRQRADAGLDGRVSSRGAPNEGHRGLVAAEAATYVDRRREGTGDTRCGRLLNGASRRCS